MLIENTCKENMVSC